MDNTVGPGKQIPSLAFISLYIYRTEIHPRPLPFFTILRPRAAIREVWPTEMKGFKKPPHPPCRFFLSPERKLELCCPRLGEPGQLSLTRAGEQMRNSSFLQTPTLSAVCRGGFVQLLATCVSPEGTGRVTQTCVLLYLILLGVGGVKYLLPLAQHTLLRESHQAKREHHGVQERGRGQWSQALPS